MLEDWIYKGQINDPYNEFMIVEDKDISKEKLKDEFNEKYPFSRITIIYKKPFILIFFNRGNFACPLHFGRKSIQQTEITCRNFSNYLVKRFC
jgi:hypothetical protein